jgi:hypothetical protein
LSTFVNSKPIASPHATRHATDEILILPAGASAPAKWRRQLNDDAGKMTTPGLGDDGRDGAPTAASHGKRQSDATMCLSRSFLRLKKKLIAFY